MYDLLPLATRVVRRIIEAAMQLLLKYKTVLPFCKTVNMVIIGFIFVPVSEIQTETFKTTITFTT